MSPASQRRQYIEAILVEIARLVAHASRDDSGEVFNQTLTRSDRPLGGLRHDAPRLRPPHPWVLGTPRASSGHDRLGAAETEAAMVDRFLDLRGLLRSAPGLDHDGLPLDLELHPSRSGRPRAALVVAHQPLWPGPVMLPTAAGRLDLILDSLSAVPDREGPWRTYALNDHTVTLRAKAPQDALRLYATLFDPTLLDADPERDAAGAVPSIAEVHDAARLWALARREAAVSEA